MVESRINLAATRDAMLDVALLTLETKTTTIAGRPQVKRHAVAFMAALSLSLPGSAALGQPAPAPAVKKSPVETPQRVLFIGNSLVYYNGALQTHTHRIAAAATPPLNVREGFKSVHITSAFLHHYPIEFLVTPGNLGFKEPFQIVVLAGSIQEAMTEQARARYRQKVIEFDAIIKKHGARTVLLWLPAVVKPNPLADSDMFEKSQAMMLSVGNEVGALIIPVGLAYREAYRQRPGIKLQMGYDGSHPTVAGQYLAAGVVYASLYGKSPVGNPYDYFGALDQDTKSFIQKVADETVRSFFGR
jgi:hypothetical protein